MNQIKRKIHVIGINSFEFKELPLKLQKLFIKTENIAVPELYYADIKPVSYTHLTLPTMDHV